jgi:hypothetical protein
MLLLRSKYIYETNTTRTNQIRVMDLSKPEGRFCKSGTTNGYSEIETVGSITCGAD